MKYYYVYILQSVGGPRTHYYSGFTEDLEGRLAEHNSKKDFHTAKYAPWRLKTAVAFTDRAQALAFERYLKTSSGRAFATKRL